MLRKLTHYAVYFLHLLYVISLSLPSGVGDEEEDNGGYYYQPLNQVPDGLNAAHGDQPEDMPPVAETMQEVQERIQSKGLNLPQPPPLYSDPSPWMKTTWSC
uniref:Uncharacterized protein n=1 Tax=Oncorhynchus tshawytscha TaxID=74940 RepID=A0AAZ3RQM1_ONCTS